MIPGGLFSRVIKKSPASRRAEFRKRPVILFFQSPYVLWNRRKENFRLSRVSRVALLETLELWKNRANSRSGR
jgi:hypothetical protein